MNGGVINISKDFDIDNDIVKNVNTDDNKNNENNERKINIINIENEIEQLTNEILKYNDLYYNKNISEISDYEYDLKLRRLEELERLYPEFRKSNSPTRVVGAAVSGKFEKVVHEVKMESLQDAFSFDELVQFDKRVCSKVNNDVFYLVEPKVDGLSVSLEYINGVFFRGSTRGDGFIGENVTQNLMMIDSIPKKLNKNIEFLEVRAEVFMSPERFRKLNLASETPFKNPRNAASGTLRQKDSNVVKERGLDAVVFNLQRVVGVEILSHAESIKFFADLGFKTVPESKVFSTVSDCIEEIEKINNNRYNYDFEIDGAVVKVNSFNQRSQLGSTAKFPHWAIAYKYEPEQKETILRDIKINVGRTGVLTPVAVFDSIILGQTLVTKASLHNQDFINSNDIRIGDKILVRKAGEIIPEVIKSVKHGCNSEPYIIPKNCPVCGSEVFKNEDEVAIRCINPNCLATLTLNIVHFASKSAMNIEGLGKTIITELVSKSLVTSVDELYYLDKEKLFKLNNFAEKSANNLLKSIEKSKKNPLWRLVCGLGIRGVGEGVSKIICQNYKDIFEIEKADTSNLCSIDGIGNIVASNIVDFFSLEETKRLVLEFKKLGLNLDSNIEVSGRKLEGLIFVITGKLIGFSRGEFKEIIEKNGGEVHSSVTTKVNYLVAGEKAGSKLEKAKKLNIEILTQEQFFNLLDKDTEKI